MKCVARCLVIVPFWIMSLSAQAAETPLNAVPDNASVVICLKAPDRTVAKIASLANAVQPGMGEAVQQRAAALGTVFENPTMVGMDRTKDWWVVVFAKSDADPVVVFATPTTDAAGLKNAVGAEYQFVDYEKYVFYTRDADKSGAIKQLAGGTGKSIETLLADKSREIFDTGDISIFLNVNSLKETYQEQLDQLKLQIDGGLQTIPTVEGMNSEALAGMYGRIVNGLFQAIDDTRSFTIATLISDNGILFDEYSSVKSDSPTDKFLKKQPTSELNLLSELPPGMLLYFGMRADTAALQDWSMDFLKAVVTDKQEQEDLEKLSTEMSALKVGDTAGGFSLNATGESGLVKGITITESSDPAKMQEWLRKWADSMSKLDIAGMRQEIKLEKDAETYGDYAADVITNKQEFDPNTDPSGMQAHIYEMMFGPDGMTQSYIYLKEHVVQAINVDRETILGVIESLTASKAETADGEVMKARQSLSKKANLVALFDLPQALVAVLRAVMSSGLLPVPIDPAMLDDLKIESSYVGFSITSEPQGGVRFVWNVPVEQARGVFGMVMQMQAIMGGGF